MICHSSGHNSKTGIFHINLRLHTTVTDVEWNIGMSQAISKPVNRTDPSYNQYIDVKCVVIRRSNAVPQAARMFDGRVALLSGGIFTSACFPLYDFRPDIRAMDRGILIPRD